MPPAPRQPSDDRPVVSTALLLGRCLAAMRREFQLSQAELASRLALSRASTAQLETGRSAPSFHVLARLGHGRRDGPREWTAAQLFELFNACVRELRRQGVRMVNRTPLEGEPLADVARVDRVVGRVLDELAEAERVWLEGGAPAFEGDGYDDE